MAQSVERFTRNEQVGSSNLPISSKKPSRFDLVFYFIKISFYFKINQLNREDSLPKSKACQSQIFVIVGIVFDDILSIIFC